MIGAKSNFEGAKSNFDICHLRALLGAPAIMLAAPSNTHPKLIELWA